MISGFRRFILKEIMVRCLIGLFFEPYIKKQIFFKKKTFFIFLFDLMGLKTND